MHEYQLNANRTFVVAGHTIIGVAFESEFFMELQFQMDSILPGALTDALVNGDINSGPYLYGTGLRSPEEMASGNMFEAFLNISRLDCSVLGDRISIALNIMGLRVSFHGSPVSEDECRWLLALIALCSGDASVLGCEGSSLVNLPDSIHQTWLRWPTIDEQNFSTFESVIMPKFSLDSNIQAIGLDAITLDVLLPKACLELPSEDSYRRASSFLNTYLGLPGYPSTNHGHSVGDNVLAAEPIQPQQLLGGNRLDDADKNFIVHNLACALSCGITWIINTLDEMDGPLKSLVEERYEDLDEQLQQHIWQTAIEKLFSTEDSDALRNNMHAKERIEKHLCFLLSPFAFFADYTSFTLLVVRIGVGNKRAIYYAPDLQGKYRKAPVILAVPVALNTTNAIGVRRVWSLQETDCGGYSATLAGKGYLYGCGSLQVGQGDAQLLQNLRVVGPLCDSRSTSPLL